MTGLLFLFFWGGKGGNSVGTSSHQNISKPEAVSHRSQPMGRWLPAPRMSLGAGGRSHLLRGASARLRIAQKSSTSPRDPLREARCIQLRANWTLFTCENVVFWLSEITRARGTTLSKKKRKRGPEMSWSTAHLYNPPLFWSSPSLKAIPVPGSVERQQRGIHQIQLPCPSLSMCFSVCIGHCVCFFVWCCHQMMQAPAGKLSTHSRALRTMRGETKQPMRSCAETFIPRSQCCSKKWQSWKRQVKNCLEFFYILLPCFVKNPPMSISYRLVLYIYHKLISLIYTCIIGKQKNVMAINIYQPYCFSG